MARREDRIVVTQDLDFSTLLALGGYDRPSLITIRLSVSDPDTVARRQHKLNHTKRTLLALRDGKEARFWGIMSFEEQRAII